MDLPSLYTLVTIIGVIGTFFVTTIIKSRGEKEWRVRLEVKVDHIAEKVNQAENVHLNVTRLDKETEIIKAEVNNIKKKVEQLCGQVANLPRRRDDGR